MLLIEGFYDGWFFLGTPFLLSHGLSSTYELLFHSSDSCALSAETPIHTLDVYFRFRYAKSLARFEPSSKLLAKKSFTLNICAACKVRKFSPKTLACAHTHTPAQIHWLADTWPRTHTHTNTHTCWLAWAVISDGAQAGAERERERERGKGLDKATRLN